MSNSEMREQVDKLLNDKSITISQLSEATGVGESVLKKLRAGRQSVDKTYFESVEKLYLYAIENSKTEESSEIPKDEFTETMHNITDKHYDVFKGLVDK